MSGLHHGGQHLLEASLVLVVVVAVPSAASLCESTRLMLVVALLDEFAVGKVRAFLCGVVKGTVIAILA